MSATRWPSQYDADRYPFETRAMFACDEGTRWAESNEITHADSNTLHAALRGYAAEGHAVSLVSFDPSRRLYVADVYDLGAEPATEAEAVVRAEVYGVSFFESTGDAPQSGDVLGIFSKGRPGSLWEREADRDYRTRVAALGAEYDRLAAEVARIESELMDVAGTHPDDCPAHGAGCADWQEIA